jgi:hypothetical protein
MADSIYHSGQQDGLLAKQFCASKEFRNLKCGIATPAEDEATLKNQCSLCGTLYSGLWGPVNNAPSQVSGVDRYNQHWVAPISLACKGPVVVRSVFKMVEQPAIKQKEGWAGTDCTHSSMVHIDEGRRDASAVVRCELELPSAGGSEAERAVRAREGKCWTCGLCNSGTGCPSDKGKWYSDSYTTVATGCDFDVSKGYAMHRVGFNINPRTKIELAKFEVCNNPGCFDAAYEQQKLETAKTCEKGKCA